MLMHPGAIQRMRDLVKAALEVAEVRHGYLHWTLTTIGPLQRLSEFVSREHGEYSPDSLTDVFLELSRQVSKLKLGEVDGKLADHVSDEQRRDVVAAFCAWWSVVPRKYRFSFALPMLGSVVEEFPSVAIGADITFESVPAVKPPAMPNLLGGLFGSPIPPAGGELHRTFVLVVNCKGICLQGSPVETAVGAAQRCEARKLSRFWGAPSAVFIRATTRQNLSAYQSSFTMRT
jgi:hypothetical protein